MYTLLVTAELVIVKVIDDDVVGTSLALTQSTRRLATAHGEELHAGGCLELTCRPQSEVLLQSEVSDDALIIFQFCLNISEQPVCAVLRLAYHNHEIDEPFGVQHQPERHKDVEGRGLGMTARPHEDRFQVRRFHCGTERCVPFG